MRIVAVLLALSCAASEARADCIAAAPMASAAAAAARATPLATRFIALMGKDRFQDVPRAIVEWQALLNDAAADPTAPPEMLARGRERLAWSLDYVNKADEALVVARAADDVIRANGLENQPWASAISATLSMVQVDTGAVDAGAATAARGMAMANLAAPDSGEASFAHNAMANIAYARGQYGMSEREYGIATALAERCLAVDNGFIVNDMASHAGVLYMVGRSEDALAENERAANWALAHLAESNPLITLTLGNLGVMLRGAGRYPEAEAALRRVVDLEARYQHDSWYYRAISLSNFATVIDRQGRHDEAEALWLQSSAWHRNATIKRDPATRAYPLRFSADAAQARGDLALALTRREEAVRLMAADAPADHPELARARIELGRTMTLMGRVAEGLKIAQPAMAIVARKLEPDDVKRLTTEVDYARIVAAASGPAAGYDLIAPIATRLEAKLLDSATQRGELLRLGPIFSSSFAAVVELALATGREEAAFHALQLANLSDIVLVNNEMAARAAAGNGAAASALAALRDQVRERQSLDRARSFATASGQTAELARLDAAIRANDVLIAAAAHKLDTVFPAYRTLGRPEPITLAAFRQRLSADQVLLAPMPGDDGTIAMLVTRDGLQWRKTLSSRATVTELIARVRGSIDRARLPGKEGGFDMAAARALYAALVPNDLAALFAAHRDLLYYSSGALATLPPALLIAPGRRRDPAWLIRTHSTAVLPTLALATGDGVAAVRPIRFLGIGAPTLPARPAPSAALFAGSAADRQAIASLPALPHAARELRRIGGLIGGGSTFLIGSDATKSAVRQAVQHRFDVVAIATHALGGGSLIGLNEPALVLSLPAVPRDGNDDGLLTASDIARLHIDADWVILSACDTAGGTGSGSPAYSGLASAFMEAGARALLVSHWPVRDDAAEALTVATVEGARHGLSRPRALQQAMLALMADPHLPGAAHPATWAPFVLIQQ